jgi:hypothetical protein
MAELPTFEGWETIEKLGEGGMCAVFRVKPVSGDGPERAIKVLTEKDDASIQRFAAEARLLQKIDHPNVLKVMELREDSPPWIVMQLLAGRDLEETRVERGAMEPEEAARVFADVASGLHCVHQLGVRHRDIKPANIMMAQDGIPRLIDFGIARETAQAHVTRQGFVVGTASYLPPEIFVEEDAHGIQDSVAADVFALGQSLVELVSGEPIHERGGQAPSAVLVKVMRDKVERPYLDPREWRPTVPDDLAEICKQATAREPEDRIPTAEALATELRAWLATRTASTAAPVTRVDPGALPPPPGTAPVKVPKAPPPAAIARQSTPVPAARSGPGAGTAAAASAMGMLMMAGAQFIGLLVIVGALWVLRPVADAADPKVRAELSRAMDRTNPALQACAKKRVSGTVVLGFEVAHGRAKGVVVEQDTVGNPKLPGCLIKVIERASLPSAADGAQVRLPLAFDG